MAKKVFVLFAALVLLIVMCVPVFAATGTITASGFYDIEDKTNITITPMVGEKNATLVDADIDGDQAFDEKLYMNSDRLKVEYTGATNDAFYGVVLVTGTGLPTKDNTIYYIDQLTAENNKVVFDVYPTLPTESGIMTLYITSSVADEELIAIPLWYTVKKQFQADGLIYTLGDVVDDGSGVIDIDDAYKALRFAAKLDEPTEIQALAADVDSNSIIDIDDAYKILRYAAKLITSWD